MTPPNWCPQCGSALLVRTVAGLNCMECGMGTARDTQTRVKIKQKLLRRSLAIQARRRRRALRGRISPDS